MAFINVIIPVYNAAAYLRTAVESVLNQHFEDIRITLVDDGSSDGSEKLCDFLAAEDMRIEVIHQKNAGVSAARNAGIEHVLSESQSGYIAFLDADDFWTPEFLKASVVQCIAKDSHDIYAFGMLNCDQNQKRFSQPAKYNPEVISGGPDAVWRIKYHFAASLYSIDLLKKWSIRFFESHRYSEDKYFMMQCAFFADCIEFMPQILYVYRKNFGGAMSESVKVKPMDYYLPIIDGWIASDDFINGYKERTGKTTHAGYALADIYFMDMAAEHFKRWGSTKKLLKTIREHPHYPRFVQMRYLGNWDKRYQERILLLNHPAIYAWKYRVIGILEIPVRMARRVPIMHRIKAMRDFPLQELPES